MSAGTYAIYRDSPTITADLNGVTKTYDGLIYTGGNGAGNFSGLMNGDTNPQVGSISYGGTAQNKKNAGTYTIEGNGTSALGYTVKYNNATLTVNKADLVVSIADQTKVYDGNTTAALVAGAITAKGITVNGVTETATVNKASANYNSKNVASATSVSTVLTVADLSAASGTDLNNYNLPVIVSGKGTITPRALTINVGTVADKTADGTTSATVTPGALNNLVAGESFGGFGYRQLQ